MKLREAWSNKFAFIMATAGAAVGLGNIWRFPYICGENGGGAFILVYLICIFVIGTPVMISELLIGRTAKRGSGSAFNNLVKKPNFIWTVVGLLGVIIAFIVSSYYTIIAGWTLDYLLHSFDLNFINASALEINNYYLNFMASDNQQILWHLVFTLLTTLILSGGISSSIEVFNKICMPFLFLILIGLVFFALNLELSGHWDKILDAESIKFLFKADWTHFNKESFFRALGQAAFTLSIASGTMISYGSYLDQKEDLAKLSLIVVSMDTFVALVAGLIIFPIIFHFNLPLDSGTGLVFVSLPTLFNAIPFGQIFAIIFYLLLCFAALSSSIAILEPVVTHLIDECKFKRQISALIAGLLSAILGVIWIKVGTLEFSNTFTNIDKFISDLLIPIEAIAISIFVGWVLDKKIYTKALKNSSSVVQSLIYFLIRWVSPIGIFIILINTF
jgi:NSS family neurotransmitter:Na+ symporter